MTHPLIPQILEMAKPLAETFGLEIVSAIFHTHHNPPVLRIDIRNPTQDTSLNDCEQMSRVLEAALDNEKIIPDAYILEISSPGLSDDLTSDRDFISFKGFPVTVLTSEPLNGHMETSGSLLKRDETAIYLNQKGRKITIPRHLVTKVQLSQESY